jgi:hypothetical protein
LETKTGHISVVEHVFFANSLVAAFAIFGSFSLVPLSQHDLQVFVRAEWPYCNSSGQAVFRRVVSGRQKVEHWGMAVRKKEKVCFFFLLRRAPGLLSKTGLRFSKVLFISFVSKREIIYSAGALNATQNNVVTSETWLSALDEAAVETGVWTMWDSPMCSHIVESSRRKSALQGLFYIALIVIFLKRKTGSAAMDYWPGNAQWKSGWQANLYWSLGLLPWKDSFWSSSKTQPKCIYEPHCMSLFNELFFFFFPSKCLTTFERHGKESCSSGHGCRFDGRKCDDRGQYLSKQSNATSFAVHKQRGETAQA